PDIFSCRNGRIYFGSLPFWHVQHKPLSSSERGVSPTRKYTQKVFDMCGIAGVISIDGSPTTPASGLRRMTARMQRRGPDDEGFVLVSPEGKAQAFSGNDSHTQTRLPHIDHAMDMACIAALGHRRLSIIDLSEAGHQPMASTDGRYWIVYNGEIYNYPEIATELEKGGVSFRGRSDTEVLLNAYIRWGDSCLTRLNGMFAFAIWDNNRRELFCARDRIGIKPFYYTIQDGSFLFASDIKTLIASGFYRPEIDMEGLYHGLSFGITPRPRTCFKGVAALEQGHSLRIGTNLCLKKTRYWKIPLGQQKNNMTLSDAVALVDEKLNIAVKRRLVADVPVGTFMSGGIDSTTISAIAAKNHPGIKAFTLGFDQTCAELDEVPQARATANLYNMSHIVSEVKPEDFIQHIGTSILGYEEPFYTLAANFMISSVVAKHDIKVVLNGLGGDELFSGYDRSKWSSRMRWMRPMRWALRFGGTLNNKLARWDYLSGLSPDRLHTTLMSHLEDSDKRSLFHNADWNTLDFVHDLYTASCHFSDDVEAFCYMDMINYLGNHHVHRLDQFTMHFSIEGRLPFLDHELVEAAFTIPARHKRHKGQGKFVLRKLAEKYIHQDCLSMAKKGFGLPLERWMKGPLEQMVRISLEQLKQRGIFNEDAITRLYREYQKGTRPHTDVWQLVSTELWCQKFFDESLEI
ncbi:MAG: asparagine synthase (glutamine-hydrolyzing), partial [Pseudomonadales bacterium]|nr:asparagine synthase (glutamine-hydrolyzing) [Pseudomonadales bacterium]